MSTPTDVGARLRQLRTAGLGDLLFVPLVLLVIVAYLGIVNEAFLTKTNLTNILLQGAVLAIVALGMTFLILAAELDLSVGAGVALVSVVAALVMRDTGSVLVGVLAGVGVGAAVGVINGLIVTKLEVPSFIATLGMLVILEGIALLLTDAAVVGRLPEGVKALTNDTFLGIRLILWLLLAVFVALYLLQSRTTFGARVFAVGGSPEAARLSGISVDRTRFFCFVIAGVAVGIAGVALTARVGSGQPGAGGVLALTSIAAIVIGGTSLYGGRGSVVRTVWGVLLISVVENGLDLEGVNVDMQRVVIGIVFIVAAGADFFRRRWRQGQRNRAVEGVA